MRTTLIRPMAALVFGMALASTAQAEMRVLDFENAYGGQPSCDTCTLDPYEGVGGGYVETGLKFFRWVTYDVKTGQLGYDFPSGYPFALNSGKFVASNFAGNNAEISSATPFSLVSAHMSAGWRDGLTFNVVGSLGGVQVYSQEVVLNSEEGTLVQFNGAAIDFVEFRIDDNKGEQNPFYPGGGFAWSMDDLKVNVSPVPEPATWGLLAGGLALLAARRRSAGPAA